MTGRAYDSRPRRDPRNRPRGLLPGESGCGVETGEGMSSQAETMGMYGSGRMAEPWHLVRKVFLLLLLVVALALGLVLLLERSRPAPDFLFYLLADGSIGAAMGLGSRIVLRRRHWLIRAIVSASLSIVGLILLGALTDAKFGVGPLDPQWQRVHWLDQAAIALSLPMLPGTTQTDLLDAAHMVIAVDLSWLVLRAWRGRARIARRGTDTGRWSRPETFSSTPARLSVAGPPPVSVSAARPGTTRHSRPVIKRRRIGRPVIASAGVVHPRASRGRQGLMRRRSAVQLATYEEHRCPYCLEDIRRGDVRGSVECPICHTQHHRDCWDITGTCQVPHLNG